MIERQDPYSGEWFTPKRTNQRFSSRLTQVAYNNAKAKELRDEMNKIDIQIRKNWQILSDTLGENVVINQSKEYLLGCGYNFNFYNNNRAHNNNRYYGVYDFGIRPLTNNIYELVKFSSHE